MDKGDTGSTVADPQAPTAAADPPGTPSSGLSRYKLGPILGRGGMGEVVSAIDDRMGRSVAVKRLRTAAPSSEAIARFLREAKIQGRVEHPAIVPVHELAQDDAGAPFFVMKQLAGDTLDDVLVRLADGDAKTTAEFSRQRLLRAFAEVARSSRAARSTNDAPRNARPSSWCGASTSSVAGSPHPVVRWGHAGNTSRIRPRVVWW